jgi:hypothetical protein
MSILHINFFFKITQFKRNNCPERYIRIGQHVSMHINQKTTRHIIERCMGQHDDRDAGLIMR